MAQVVIDKYSLSPLSTDQVSLEVGFHVSDRDAFWDPRPLHVWFALVEADREQYSGLEMPAANEVPSLRTDWIYAGLYSPGVSTRISKRVRCMAMATGGVAINQQRLIAATLPANIEARRSRREDDVDDDVKAYLHFA
ncbi:MAG: hypothetical protein AB1810_05640 [Pseudomonadota bacterium]